MVSMLMENVRECQDYQEQVLHVVSFSTIEYLTAEVSTFCDTSLLFHGSSMYLEDQLRGASLYFWMYSNT